MNICTQCVNIHNVNNEGICKECEEARKAAFFNEARDFDHENIFTEEMKNFLQSRQGQSVLYAYSGGQDSTATLYKLKEACQAYKILLKIFTIDNGFKGVRTLKNIYDCLEYLKLSNNWEMYNIRNDMADNPYVMKQFNLKLTVEEVYALCFLNNTLPCGPLCNSIMDNKYNQILKENNEEILITGGDTPKINEHNGYSIFWRKKSGIKVVRGAAGFRINKDIGAQIIAEKKIPWEDPNYGGYDTDCLVPGSIFASSNNGSPKINIEEIYKEYAVVYEYLKERTRLGIMDRSKTLEMINLLDIPSYAGYTEMKNTACKIIRRKLEKLIGVGENEL
jgi:predicted PP-loop superfamily ATPase